MTLSCKFVICFMIGVSLAIIPDLLILVFTNFSEYDSSLRDTCILRANNKVVQNTDPKA